MIRRHQGRKNFSRDKFLDLLFGKLLVRGERVVSQRTWNQSDGSRRAETKTTVRKVENVPTLVYIRNTMDVKRYYNVVWSQQIVYMKS